MENTTDSVNTTRSCFTSEFWQCRVAVWIRICVPIVLLLIGTCGNFLNIVILTRKALRQYSTSIYLIFLAVSDTLVLWSSLASSLFFYIFHQSLSDLSSLHCKLTGWLSFSGGIFSSWIIVAVTLERVIMIKYPLYAKLKFSPKFALIVSCLILLFTQMLTSHLLYGLHPKITISTHNSTVYRTQDCVYVSDQYRDFYNKIWNYIVLFGCNIASIIFIVIGNCILGIKIFRQRKKIQPSKQQHMNIRKKEIQTTRMLFILCLFHICTTTPFCIFVVVWASLRSNLSEKGYAVGQLFSAVVSILLWCNYSFNFLLYFTTGKLFKNEWEKLMKSSKVYFSKLFPAKQNSFH